MLLSVRLARAISAASAQPATLSTVAVTSSPPSRMAPVVALPAACQNNANNPANASPNNNSANNNSHNRQQKTNCRCR